MMFLNYREDEKQFKLAMVIIISLLRIGPEMDCKWPTVLSINFNVTTLSLYSKKNWWRTALMEYLKVAQIVLSVFHLLEFLCAE